MAWGALPGMPKATVGSSAPPSLASLAASGASTPSGAPRPKLARLGEVAWPWAYDRNAATLAPTPGMIPTTQPMVALRISRKRLDSTKRMPSRTSLALARSTSPCCTSSSPLTARKNISETAKIPMAMTPVWTPSHR